MADLAKLHKQYLEDSKHSKPTAQNEETKKFAKVYNQYVNSTGTKKMKNMKPFAQYLISLWNDKPDISLWEKLPLNNSGKFIVSKTKKANTTPAISNAELAELHSKYLDDILSEKGVGAENTHTKEFEKVYKEYVNSIGTPKQNTMKSFQAYLGSMFQKKPNISLWKEALTAASAKKPSVTQKIKAPKTTTSTVPIDINAVPKLKDLKLPKSLGGSTGAKLYVHKKTGKRWVVKKASSGGGFGQVLFEDMANILYKALKIPVPNCETDFDSESLILEYIDGKLLSAATPSELDMARKELSKGFIVDALIANWDVIGLAKDNIILPNDGSPPVRIDNGGSFTYKATGGAKPFTDEVYEIDTMLDPKINPQAADIFKHITDADIIEQINTIIKPNEKRIESIFAASSELKDSMRSRVNYLLGLADFMSPEATKMTPVKETEMPDHVKDVESALVEFFKDDWKKLNPSKNNAALLDSIRDILTKHGAIIGGGFILKSIGAFKDATSIDIDIYVDMKNAVAFKNDLQSIFNQTSKAKHDASNTEQSFLKKNGILSVTKYPNIDVVEIAPGKTPTDVIKHADLTFCANWYDGKTVYMTYPEDVKEKKGFLQNAYLGFYYKKNEKLFTRLKKYDGRGFEISIHNPVTKKDEIIKSEIDAYKHPISTYKKSNKDMERNDKITSLPTAKNELLAQIKNSINAQSANSSKLNIDISVAKLPTHLPPANKAILTDIEYLCLSFYTGTGFTFMNEYLYTSDKIYKRHLILDKAVQVIMKKFPREASESTELYNSRIIYYMIVNLYNGIQKAPKINPPLPFKVYRGSKTSYLKEGGGAYYMNSFVSTTSSETIQAVFGSKYYVFYIHPACRYMNVEKISLHKKEKEILLTPYHRYKFVTSVDSKSIFLILPTDLTIPNTFAEFADWKLDKGAKPAHLSGGRLATLNHRPIAFKNTTLKKKLNRNRVSMATTRKRMNSNSKTIETSGFYERLTAPIPSFEGKQPTKEEQKVIDQMVDMIRQIESGEKSSARNHT